MSPPANDPCLVMFALELFKAWRREHASREFDLYEFPWIIPELDEAYKGQLLVR